MNFILGLSTFLLISIRTIDCHKTKYKRIHCPTQRNVAFWDEKRFNIKTGQEISIECPTLTGPKGPMDLHSMRIWEQNEKDDTLMGELQMQPMSEDGKYRSRKAGPFEGHEGWFGREFDRLIEPAIWVKATCFDEADGKNYTCYQGRCLRKADVENVEDFSDYGGAQLYIILRDVVFHKANDCEVQTDSATCSFLDHL